MARRNQEPYIEDDLYETFRAFDKDGSGFVAASDLPRIVEAVGERLTKEEADEMIRGDDIDDDGQINYDEFIAIMMAK